MKAKLLKLIIKILHWLIVRKGQQLQPIHLLKNGWVVETVGRREFLVEPFVKDRDKVWIEFEAHYYRVYHGENRTFVALESRLEWLQSYLFVLDYHGELQSRRLL